jgi:hypothetical protein
MTFSNNSPIEADVDIFYPIVVPHNPWDHELNKIDSALYQDAFM